jgi:hypothetical protein
MHIVHRIAPEPPLPRRLIHLVHRLARDGAFPRDLLHLMHRPHGTGSCGVA